MRYPNVLPTCLDYAEFLRKICKKEKITLPEARSKYGQFTYIEWWTLLLKGTKKLPWNGLHKEITYHRQPTASEIRFGYGATHYRDFSFDIFLKNDGTIKKRLKADDGLIYIR